MWLQTEQREVARDGALGNPGMRRHAAHAPVGGGGGFAVQHLAQQARDLFVAMAAGAARTKFRVQPGEAALLITLAPQTDHRGLTPQRRATSRLAAPSADSNTICARRTNECGRLREPTSERNCARSDGLIAKAVFGLPIPATSAGTLAGGPHSCKLIYGTSY